MSFKKYDVIVVGAGVAGCCAAIASAEMGRQTLLIEQDACPGGVAVNCGCPSFMGFGDGQRQAVGGIGERLLRQLDAMGAIAEINSQRRITSHLSEGPLTGTYTTTEPLLALCLNRMLEKAGVERSYYTVVTGAEIKKQSLDSIQCFCMGRTEKISAHAFVDTTGDAILAKLGGLPVNEGNAEESMTKTVLFKVTGVKDFDKVLLREKFTRLCIEKKFPFPEQDLFMGCQLGNTDEVLLNLSQIAGNALDREELTRMDVALREQVFVILKWLQKNFSEFTECRLAGIAPKIGIRAGRTIDAVTMITCADLLRNTPVEEPVALGRRRFGGHGIYRFCNPWDREISGWRGIPYGALKARGVNNLLAGGRAIGAETQALSAIRMMPCCMATGHAAGTAAALSVPPGVLPSYADLRKCLLKQNAILI